MRIRLVLLCCILTIFSCQKSDDPVLLHDQEVGLEQLDSPTKKGASKNAADSEIIEAMKLQVAKNSKGVNHKYGAPQWDYAMVMKDDTNADLAFIPCIKPGIDEVSAIIIVYIPNGQSLKMKGYKRDKIIKLKNKKNSKNKALSLELGLILLTSMDTKIFGSTDCDLVNLLNSFYKKGGSKSCSTDVYIIETDWYQYNPTSGEYAHLDSTYDYIWLDVCSNGAVVGDESGGSPSEPNDSDGETNTSTSNLNEEVEEITTNNLREFLQEVCRSPLYGWELNRVAGAAFEEAILNAMEFNRNTSNIESNERLLASNGSANLTRPDAFAAAQDVTGGIIYNQGIAIEIKAYSGEIRLSTSNYQIMGEIDILVNLNQEMIMDNRKPAFFLYTSCSATVNNDIRDYAESRGVAVYHINVHTSDNGELEICNFRILTDEGISSTTQNLHNYYLDVIGTTMNGQIRCPDWALPDDTNNPDPEVAN